MENFICKYCGKICKNKNSLIQHEIRCKLNSNRIDISNSLNALYEYNHSDNHISTNQFIKAKALGLPVPVVSKNTREKIGKIWKGKKQPIDMTIKIRNTIIERHKKLKYFANFNINACKYIDILNKEKHWNLQHALNGGEKYVNGFYLDGYDKNLNIAFEYDEPKHYIDVNNNILKENDIIRQQKIIDFLHCDFWRYNEKINLLYKI